MKFFFKFPKRTFIQIALAFLILTLGACSVTRKINAADILSKTKIEFVSVSLDSVTINAGIFPKTGLLAGGFLPNPQVVALVQDFSRGILEKELGTIGLTAGLIAHSESSDTLWIRNLQATIKLDSIIELPISLKEPVKMGPGDNLVHVTTTMPIDKRIFLLKDVSKINMNGMLTVALDVNGEAVSLDFNIDREVSQEEKITLMDNARNSILNSIVNGWVGAIQD